MASSLHFIRYALSWVVTIGMSSAQLLFTVGGMGRWSWEFIPYYWSIMTFFALGIRVNVVGAEKLVGPAVFVMNHQSLVDVALVPRILPRRILYVVKKEMQKVPFFGPALCSTGAISIDRSNPGAAFGSIASGLSGLPGDYSVMVFPEGTRSNDGQVKAFKKGFVHIARASGLPVIPIGISGAMQCCGYGDRVPRPGLIECTVGEAIEISPQGDVGAEVARVRELVCALEALSSRRRWLEPEKMGACSLERG